jgi:hypothetical protein
VSTEAERAAAAAKWQQAVGAPDPRAAAWADEVLDRVEADQAKTGADRRAS